MTRPAILAICLLSTALGSSTIGPWVTLADELAESAPSIGDDCVRVRFPGDRERGFEVVFQCKTEGRWTRVAGYPAGRPWTVYADWKDSWYTDAHSVPASTFATAIR
jgi:hypothetical protein